MHLYVMGDTVDRDWVFIGKSKGKSNLRDLDIENIDMYLKYLMWGFEVECWGSGYEAKTIFGGHGVENKNTLTSPSNFVLPIHFQSNTE